MLRHKNNCVLSQDGVSQVQKCKWSPRKKNVYTIGVEGNFDDAQSGVKAIFTDEELKQKMDKGNFKFSSANSINWGDCTSDSLLFSAYADMLKNGEIKRETRLTLLSPQEISEYSCGFLCNANGLPVNRLICASNDNNVLTILSIQEYMTKQGV